MAYSKNMGSIAGGLLGVGSAINSSATAATAPATPPIINATSTYKNILGQFATAYAQTAGAALAAKQIAASASPTLTAQAITNPQVTPIVPSLFTGDFTILGTAVKKEYVYIGVAALAFVMIAAPKRKKKR